MTFQLGGFPVDCLDGCETRGECIINGCMRGKGQPPRTDDGRPRTVEEFAALPEFGFGKRRFDLSEEDRANGYITVDDRRVYVSGPNIRAVEVADVNPPFVAHMIGDMEGYTDANGVDWRLVLRADGKWFRGRV